MYQSSWRKLHEFLPLRTCWHEGPVHTTQTIHGTDDQASKNVTLEEALELMWAKSQLFKIRKADDFWWTSGRETFFMDYRVHGVLQARILEWVAFPCSSRSSQPSNQTGVSCTAGGSLPTELSGKPFFATPWTIVHGTLQAKILEWVTFLCSRGSSQPRDQTQVSHMAGGFFTSWATREALIPR